MAQWPPDFSCMQCHWLTTAPSTFYLCPQREHIRSASGRKESTGFFYRWIYTYARASHKWVTAVLQHSLEWPHKPAGKGYSPAGSTLLQIHLGHRCNLTHGQCLIGRLAGQELGKNKIRRLSARSTSCNPQSLKILASHINAHLQSPLSSWTKGDCAWVQQHRLALTKLIRRLPPLSFWEGF